MSKISVVIPAYNAERSIACCLQSAMSQTYKDLEVIVVDDGSLDKTAEIAKSITSTLDLKNIKIYSIENGGANHARWYGVQQAQGEYVCFLDADDVMPVNAVQALYDFLKINNLDIACGGMCKVKGNDHTNYIGSQGIYNRIQYVDALLRNLVHAGPWGKLFKKSLFCNEVFAIPADVRRGEDYLMNVRLATRCQKAGVTEQLVYHYIMNEESIIHTFNTTFDYEMRYVEMMEQSVGEEIKPHVADGLFRFRLRVLFALLQSNVHLSSSMPYMTTLLQESHCYPLNMQERFLLFCIYFPWAFNFLNAIRVKMKQLIIGN